MSLGPYTSFQEVINRDMEDFEDETIEVYENVRVEQIEYVEVQYITDVTELSGNTLLIQIPAFIVQSSAETESNRQRSSQASTAPGPSNIVVNEPGGSKEANAEPNNSMVNQPSSTKQSAAIPGSSDVNLNKQYVNNGLINQAGPNEQMLNQPGPSKQSPSTPGPSDKFCKPMPSNSTHNPSGTDKQRSVPRHSNEIPNQPGTSRQGALPCSSNQLLNQPGTSSQSGLARSQNINRPSTSRQALADEVIPIAGPSHGTITPSTQGPRRNKVPRMPVTADYDPSTDGPIESPESPEPQEPLEPTDTSEPSEQRTRVSYCFCKKQGDLDRFARAKRKRDAMLARRPPRLLLTCRGYEHGVEAIISTCVNTSEDRISSDLRTFVVAERLYTVLDKSVAAIVFGISKYQKMLRKRKFTLVTDQPIFVKIFDRATLHQTVPNKWKRVAAALALFDYDIVYKPRPPKRNYVRPFLPFYFY